ncbi:DUF4398 domain-containing protein [Diaphorobacter aerolatus]|uniref:DUF4398 domain-containing protein n=1 Tax=Diaphorobacter aerolatus TaxID=1288495 RepID=A0A7H0GGY9_9BURK|nr:DUF4398 domain-containing protein [Diaphorobacter aerolatus]QNP47555.1 DUF4398 domain-containing protein [Diaphorobacter aerolatus]
MQSKYLRSTIAVLAIGALAACSSIPAPTGEMAVAQSAVERASNSPQVTTHAPVEIQNARDLWSKAQRAMDDKKYADARRYAEAAEAEARVAESKAQVGENKARLQAVERGYQVTPAPVR